MLESGKNWIGIIKEVQNFMFKKKGTSLFSLVVDRCYSLPFISDADRFKSIHLGLALSVLFLGNLLWLAILLLPEVTLQ